MIEKIAEHALHFSGRRPISALNRPKGWEIFENGHEFAPSVMKVASTISKDVDNEDLGGFDLEAGVKDHPDHLFVKVLAIKKDEPNDNGDAFNEEELKKATQSFIGCPLFCNHANDDIEKARGKVVHAWYDDKSGGIWTINMVDKVAYPKLARGIEEGYITGTSMGCQVQYSICSICHNKAHVADEYCTHVKERKTKKFSGKTKCKFHDSKCKPKSEDNCPVCNCSAKNTEEIVHKEALIHEWNYGLKFIEDSFVVNPACHDCLVECILNVPEMTKESTKIIDRARKIAKLMGEEHLIKVASVQNVKLNSLASEIDYIIHKVSKLANSKFSEKLFKISGRIEIDNLNKAMKFMEVVAKSMMDQKEQVSMEYVSDIIDVLASLQTVTDELVEMGYANLQSPPTLQDPMSLQDAVPVGGAQQPSQTQPGAMQPAAASQPQPQQSAGQQPIGDVGSVTKPTLSSRIKEELVTAGENIDEANRGTNPQVKESDTNMPNPQKTAAGNGQKPEYQNVTTEKQLADAKLEFHARTGHEPEGVTESKAQIGGSEQMNDVSSDSPQVRSNEYAEVTTENQLTAYTGSPIARWNEYPDVILEKSWTDFTREVGAKLSKDQADHSTQGQLQDLLSKHRWVEPVVTTENQLADTTNWLNEDNAWLSKSASVRSAYSKAIVTAAVNSLVDTIANYSVTPSEVIKAAKFISSDPQTQIKAAFITLINGVPGKKATRQAEVARNKYFGKASSVSAVDALLACTGDNCTNIKAEDLIAAVSHISQNAGQMASVETKAKAKLAKSVEVDTDIVVDKYAAFDAALAEIGEEKPECTCRDGAEGLDPNCYRCNGKKADSKKEASSNGLHIASISLEEIDASPEDQSSFVAATEKLAKAQFPGLDAVVYSIDIDDANSTAEVTLKETQLLTASEVAAIKQAKTAQRSAMTKEAQAMGGEMGGGMGGGAGAGGPGGTTMPTPPGAPAQPGMPPAETMSEDPMGGGEEEGGEGDAEAKPPGSICPVCGTQDVDIVAGKGRCNNENCGAEFVFKVQVDVTKWPGVNDTNTDDGEGAPDMNEEVGDASADGTGEPQGEGFAMPEGGAGADASIPVAAMTRLTPSMKKLAASGKLGEISPLTGSKNTFAMGNGEFLCLDTGRTYSVHVAVDKKNVKNVFAEWRWTPKTAKEECTSCRRAKSAWSQALKSAGLTNKQYEEKSFRAKADTILAMASKGMFKTVKTASKNASVMKEIKAAYATKQFPTNECRAIIAKRFGENAIALSGPDKGKNLADCVCNQLKKASVYSDGLAIKVADTWKDKDACVECMEDYVRLGYDMEKAATVCQYMKLKYASGFELFAEEMADMAPIGGDEMGSEPVDPMGGEVGGGMGEEDPFANDGGEPLGGDMGGDHLGEEAPVDPMGGAAIEDPLGTGVDINLGDDLGGGDAQIAVEPGNDSVGGHGSVTIELPLSALDAIENAIDSAHGRSGDEGGEEGLPDEGSLPNEGGAELGGDDDVDGDELGNEEVGGDDDGGDDDKSDGMGFGGEDDGGDDKGPGGNPFGDKGGEGKEPEADNTETKEGKEMDHLASYMRKGKISGNREINLDIAGLAAALKKKAGDSEPKQENAQDATEVTYTAGDGSTQGSEEKFKADNPSVPRNKATIGEEADDANPQDGPQPTVPHGGGEMGEEKELGYTAEGVDYTGGANGAGKTPTASAKTTQKKADKLNAPKPVSETDGLDVPRSNKDHANTPEKMKRTTLSPKDYPEKVEKGEGARIGGEVDNGSVPKANSEYTPDIPVGGSKAALDKEEKSNKEFAPEKQTDRSKGTVSAGSGNKSKAEAEAVRIAGRMVETRMIGASQLLEKIAELKQYELPTLKQIEATLFAAKGLATDPDGVESAVIISEASNQRKPSNAKEELSDALKSLFTLDKRNKFAESDENADLRKSHNRR